MTRRVSAPISARVWWRLEYSVNELLAPGITPHLRRLINEGTAAPSSTVPVVVSMTTHGARFRSAHLALASILRGSLIPARLVLWLDDEYAFHHPTDELRMLTEYGLELKFSRNYGPHTKYYAMVQELSETESGNKPLVTADDDVLYPRTWLQGLFNQWQEQPGIRHCYRAHRIRFSSPSCLAPYNSWGPAWGKGPSMTHFATGVSGVLYPQGMIHRLAEAGDGFLTTCPTNDDVWLNAIAAEWGISARQVHSIPRLFPTVPGSQSINLVSINVGEGKNDDQIRATYSPRAVRVLRGHS